MTDDSRREVAENAMRWCENILSEVLSNHGRVLPAQCRDKLRIAVIELSEAVMLSRFEKDEP